MNKTAPTLNLFKGIQAISVAVGGLITCGLFIAIPLTQIATESNLDNEVRRISIYTTPPPPPLIEDIAKMEEKTEEDENVELKKEYEKLNLATINMALNAGSGGSGPSVYVGSFEIDNSDLSFEMTYEISDLDRAPIPVLQIAPQYPWELKRAGISGKVDVEFVVTKEGEVIKIKIRDASHNEFIAPVLAALRKWRFEPGIKDDQAVNTRVLVPFLFNWEST